MPLDSTGSTSETSSELSPRGDSREVFQYGLMFCWISGWTPNYRPPDWHAATTLQVAHVASGQGRALRVDDRRAVVVLSPLVHDLHVSCSDKMSSKVIGRFRYPTIDERHTLWIKRYFDPEFYDPDFLQRYWHGKLPQPERPPERWLQEMQKNQGILL